MNEKIKITLNHRILDSIWNNDKILIMILLLILKHYLKGRTKAVELDLITYIFDVLKKDLKITKENVLLSEPWDITNLRIILILAYEMKLIHIVKKNSRIGFNLTEKGNELLDKLEGDNLIDGLSLQIEKISIKVKINNLRKQHLIW